MKNLIVILLAITPYVVSAQNPQNVTEFNKLGKEAFLKKDNMKAAYYYERAIELDSLDKHACNGYVATHSDIKAYNILTRELGSTIADSTYRTIRADYASKMHWYEKAIYDYKWLLANKIDIADNFYNLGLMQDKWGRELYEGHYKYNTKYAEKDKLAIDLFHDAIKNLQNYIAYNPKDDNSVIAEIGNIKVILTDYK